MTKLQDEVKALIFDTWGTLVDWRSSVLDELSALGRPKDLKIDWETFLDEWRSAYEPAKQKVNRGELPWTKMDVFYRRALVQLLAKHNITGRGEDNIDYLNRSSGSSGGSRADSAEFLSTFIHKYSLAVANGSLVDDPLMMC